jgi:hypothetical protein
VATDKGNLHAIRIYIIASHPLFAQGVSSLLESQPDIQVVGLGEPGTDTLQRIIDRKPDVVIVDSEQSARGQIADVLFSQIPGLKLVGLSLEEDNITVSYLQQKTGAAVEDLVAAVRTLPTTWLPLQRQMRILAATQGGFGQRVLENIRQHAPSHWVISVWRSPPLMPAEPDSLLRLLPRRLPAADLVLGLGESPQMAHLLPEMVARSGARAMIAPVESNRWMPLEVVENLKCAMHEMNVAAVFPKPFCSLTMRTYSEAGLRTTYQDAHVAEFARYFGRPELRILFDDARRITRCEIRRDSACGLGHLLSERLVGCTIDGAERLAVDALAEHHCPDGRTVDPEYGTTLLKVADLIVREAVRREVEPFFLQPESQPVENEVNRRAVPIPIP